MRPRYITATRSLTCSTNAEIVADHDVLKPISSLRSSSRLIDLGADRDVERRTRLVADHQLGPQDQGAGDADALALGAENSCGYDRHDRRNPTLPHVHDPLVDRSCW